MVQRAFYLDMVGGDVRVFTHEDAFERSDLADLSRRHVGVKLDQVAAAFFPADEFRTELVVGEHGSVGPIGRRIHHHCVARDVLQYLNPLGGKLVTVVERDQAPYTARTERFSAGPFGGVCKACFEVQFALGKQTDTCPTKE